MIIFVVDADCSKLLLMLLVVVAEDDFVVDELGVGILMIILTSCGLEEVEYLLLKDWFVRTCGYGELGEGFVIGYGDGVLFG